MQRFDVGAYPRKKLTGQNSLKSHKDVIFWEEAHT